MLIAEKPTTYLSSNSRVPDIVQVTINDDIVVVLRLGILQLFSNVDFVASLDHHPKLGEVFRIQHGGHASFPSYFVGKSNIELPPQTPVVIWNHPSKWTDSNGQVLEWPILDTPALVIVVVGRTALFRMRLVGKVSF
jgi:hypothetical protein